MSLRNVSLGAVCGALCVSTGAQALEIEQADSKYLDKQYRLTLVTVVEASRERVQAVLRDYRNYPKLDPRILEARVMERTGPNEVVLYTKLRACFGVFCRTIKRVERVEEGDNDLRASVLPDQSDATQGETRTQLTALNGRTRITYSTQIAPGFWIPPFIGRALMLRTLREASVDLFRRVEQQAQGQVVRPVLSRAASQSAASQSIDP